MAEEEPPSDMTMIGSPLADAGGTTPKLFGQNEPVAGRDFTLQAMTQVGRDPRNVAIYVNHPSISRVHGRITKEGGSWTVEDLQSSNGVFINDSRIQKGFLNDGDEVRFGDVKFQFKLVADTAAGKERKTMVQRLSDMTIFGGEVPKLFAEDIKQEKEAEAQASTTNDGVKKSTPASYQQELSKKYFWVKVKIAIGALLFLVVVGGGITFLAMTVSKNKKARNMVKVFKGDLKSFIKNNESKVFSPDAQKVEFISQLVELAKLNETGKANEADFPDLSTEQKEKMEEVYGELRILVFERKLALAVLAKDTNEIDNLLKALDEKGTSKQKAVVPLMKLITQFRVFSLSYEIPNVSKVAPSREEVTKLIDSRKRLTDEYSKQNSYLEIEAKQLGEMAKVALNNDANFAKSWYSFWANVEAYNSESDTEKKKVLLEKLKTEYSEVDVVKNLK